MATRSGSQGHLHYNLKTRVWLGRMLKFKAVQFADFVELKVLTSFALIIR